LIKPIQQFYVDKLGVNVFKSRSDMGAAAAILTSQKIQGLLNSKDSINIIFAAAPSQNEMLKGLVTNPEIEWGRINAFHMDEYIGLDENAPQSFGKFLKTKLFDQVLFNEVHYINTTNPESECQRYSQLLTDFPPDIVCLGIGENGHLAFNDPPVADFSDLELVKIVELDHACRQQQVNDGCFNTLDEVPKQAITLTIPALLSARYISCVVPGSTKADAVRHTLEGDISVSCPASILRRHDDVVLYLDNESFKV